MRWLPGATGWSELGLVQRGGLCTPHTPGVLQALRAVHSRVPNAASWAAEAPVTVVTHGTATRLSPKLCRPKLEAG